MRKEIALSIEQMKHLQDLGLDCSGASMSYLAYKDITDEWVEEENCINSHFKHDETSEAIISLELGYDKGSLYSDMSECSNYTCCEVTPTFCLQDIIEFLSKVEYVSNGFPMFMMVYNKSFSRWEVLFRNPPFTNPNIYSDNPLNASYEMLLWCIENGYVETNKTK